MVSLPQFRILGHYLIYYFMCKIQYIQLESNTFHMYPLLFVLYSLKLYTLQFDLTHNIKIVCFYCYFLCFIKKIDSFVNSLLLLASIWNAIFRIKITWR